MKGLFAFCCALCMAGGMAAQDGDPVVMKINGKDVHRSEFEYNFNKNNGDNVVDKKTVDEYAELFVNYKLKVEAALDAQYDTLSSFKKEFKSYRDQQIRPYFVTPGAEEREIRAYYDRMKEAVGADGLVYPAHIMVLVPQKANEDVRAKAKARIDSIYTALQGGADFSTLAKQCSEDRGTAARGGDVGWVMKGQTLKEFEEKAFALQKGETSQPFMSPMGYHIIYMKDRKQLESYEELRPQLAKFLERRGMKEHIASMAIDSLVKASGGGLSVEDVLDRKTAELCAKDDALKYLIQEYHDGLLLYEISQREVWDKAAKDTVGLEQYFKEHKSDYKWDAPRYKGVVCHSKDKALQKQVRKLLKSLDDDLWIDSLRATFNQDSVKQIRVEKSLFKKGDNVYVDHLVFKVKEKPKPMKSYPYTAVYGKKLKRPKEWTDVRGEVVSDYQAACEDEFVRDLRATYKVEIYKDALNTVNKH